MILRDNNTKRITNGQLLLLLLPMYVIILCYFSKWQTHTIYGDDLDIFHSYGTTGNTALIRSSQKYRPVNTLVIRSLMQFFGKHIAWYYYFNVGIQALIALVFIKITDIFLRTPFLSALLGLVVGLSRFNLYNISQLYNGGALEGLAMLFFLACVYILIKVVMARSSPDSEKFRWSLLALLFANLSLYTHERYMVLCLFIALLALMPGLLLSNTSYRVSIAALAVLSIATNYIIKSYIFHISFLMGTGAAKITLSPTGAVHYLTDGILSIFQFNSGPAYLVGLPFSLLSTGYSFLIILFSGFIVSAFCVFVWRTLKGEQNTKHNETPALLILLVVLFFFCIVPATVTIRLEQRWLQASFALFILMIAVTISAILPGRSMKAIVTCGFTLLFFVIDRHYLNEGAGDIYLCNSERKAGLFAEAMKNGTLLPTATRIVICEKERRDNDENEYKWILHNGTFFEYYGQQKKEISFISLAEINNNARALTVASTEYITVDSTVNNVK